MCAAVAAAAAEAAAAEAVNASTSATSAARAAPSCSSATTPARTSSTKGLTHIQFSAQRKRFLWGRGSIQGLFRGYYGGVRGCYGLLRRYFESETAQVELKSGRV